MKRDRLCERTNNLRDVLMLLSDHMVVYTVLLTRNPRHSVRVDHRSSRALWNKVTRLRKVLWMMERFC